MDQKKIKLLKSQVLNQLKIDLLIDKYRKTYQLVLHYICSKLHKTFVIFI